MTSTHIRLVLALGLALGVGVVPLVAVEVSVGGVGGVVEVCDGTVRTSLWLNTSSQAIYLRSLELRQVAEFGFEGDVRATAFVRRPGFDELMLAENWNHISDPGTRSVNTSLAPDYTTVNPGDSLRLDTQCVPGVRLFSPFNHQQILYFRYSTVKP